MALAVTNAVIDATTVGLRADRGSIVELGPEVAARPGDEVIDAHGMSLIAPFINGHTHAAMTLFRGYGSDLQLQEWLEHMIWPAEARLTADDVYWGTRLAALEMIRSGTTHFVDMYWHPEAVARAAQDAGIRATVGTPLIDIGNPSGLSALRAAALESLDALSSFGPLITPSLTPHAIYTVSRRSLEWVAETAATKNLIVHIHLSETVREVEEWRREHDLRPAPYLDDIGLLGPRTIIAHGCVMDTDEYELIAQRQATIVTNPVSNLKLASGRIFPYAKAAAAGVSVGLGTDGAASNNSLDLLADLKVFALVGKHEAYDPTMLRADEALAIAQGRRSGLLGGRDIEVGGPADFVLINTDLPQMNPGGLVENLVYAANGDVVDTTVVAGQVLMRSREVPGVREITAEARRCASRLVS